MRSTNIVLKVKVAWWVTPYLNLMAAFACVTGVKPDMGKVCKTVLRGMRISL